MSAPVSPDGFQSPRLITEAEWKKFRLERMALSDADIQSVGGVNGVLLDYQKRLLSTTAANRVTICEKSRRTGATWGVAADAVLAAAADKTSRGMDVFYIGYNLEMAREFIDTGAEWARMFNQAASEIEDYIFEDADPDKSIKAFRIRFASGHQIIALPSRPRSLRGMQGYVILDEGAFHDDLEEMMKAALALLIWGGRVLVISTHNGADNHFNALVKKARAGDYGFVRFDFDDALHDGLYRRVCLRLGEEWSVEKEAAWRAGVVSDYGDAADEELFCIPSEGEGNWLSAALLEKCARPGIPVLRIAVEPEFTFWAEHLRKQHVEDWCAREIAPILKDLDTRRAHYLGGDYGRVKDLTVLWPLIVTATMGRVTPFVVEMRRMPFDQQKQILAYICDALPRFSASKHDATGLGMSIAEFAVQKYGEMRTEAVSLNTPWYRDNAQPLKTAFEDGVIEIPMDAEIHSDLRLIRMKGGIPFVPPLKSGVNKNRHGDAAVALMLAYAATRAGVAEYDYTPAPPALKASDPAAWLFPEDESGGRSIW